VTATPGDLARRWAARWPEALTAWSSYTQLSSPIFLDGAAEAGREHMQGEIAAIRLQDQKVMVNVTTIQEFGLEDHALAVMAHEIGHHVYVPGNLADNARMLAAMGRMLTGLPNQATHLCANLYSDLLINDRLQRRAGVDIAGVYRRLASRQRGEPTETWKVYARTYERLWRLPAGTLAPPQLDASLDADALLLSRIVRSFAGNWLRGARRFASVLYRYLAEDELAKRRQTFAELGLHDTRGAGEPAPGRDLVGVVPDGLASVDPSELEDDDSFDGDVLDPLHEGKTAIPKPTNAIPGGEGKGKPGRQYRQPFEYGQLLRALGLNLKEHEVTARYYRERALPHLIRFPARRAPHAVEPLDEGHEEWDASEPLDELDVLASLSLSPVLVPGITTVQRVYGEIPGSDPARVPMNLDIYVDCSGSMPNPAMDVSYLALAGTILALSALRAGARVQATLWSGPGQFDTTHGFVRDEQRVLGIVTGYIAGSTAFPLHVLRDTYAGYKASDPPTHIVVISDDGVTTMLQPDEQGAPGASLCSSALERARGGGTLVLNTHPGEWQPEATLKGLGFRVHRVTQWEELVAFARAFVRETYGDLP
jgi:hypothetical protein